jgi:hypothetical protein
MVGQSRTLQCYGILVGTVEHTCDGIDTPEQYVECVKRIKGIDVWSIELTVNF